MTFDHFISFDAPRVQLYGWEHITFLLCSFLIMFLMVWQRKRVRAHSKTITGIFLGVILFQQTLMYGWYIFCTDVLVQDGLPPAFVPHFHLADHLVSDEKGQPDRKKDSPK